MDSVAAQSRPRRRQTNTTRLAPRPRRTHIQRMPRKRPTPPKIAQTPAAAVRADLRSWDNEGGAPSSGRNSKRARDESGPPPAPSGEDPGTSVRLSAELLAAIDRWAKQQDD